MTGMAPRGELPPGVKRTTGGTFDPDASQTYFIASSPDAVNEIEYENVLVAVNELRGEGALEALEKLLDSGRKVMLDSGIFNLAMEHVRKHGTTHDEALSMAPEDIDGFDELWNLYGKIVTTYGDRLWGMVELDQGGVNNKPRTRARIEEEFGIVPIPVYHPLLDGWDYYDDLAQGYDRICFGNIVQASTGDRLRLAHTAMERGRQYPYLWTHLLGMSLSSGTLGVRMRGSLDSSSWLAPVRWPHQWVSSGMGQNLTKFGRDMWALRGTYFDGPETFPGDKNRQLCAPIPVGQQEVFDAVLEDTHSDYSGREVAL